jgi:hypothetical protein
LPQSQPVAEPSFAGSGDLPFHRGVKNAVDLDDIIVKQALDLDHRAGWIWRLAPCPPWARSGADR